jgi:carboxypeptidase D
MYVVSYGPSRDRDLTDIFQGGPGCSSLEGLLQENGPFLWNYGTFKPVQNPWTWVNLTNMLWIEQPVGTGYTQGEGSANSTEGAGIEFLGFLKNFIDNFALHNKKIYLTGESYAGMYVPYYADAMFKQKDKKYFDIRGTMMYK